MSENQEQLIRRRFWRQISVFMLSPKLRCYWPPWRRWYGCEVGPTGRDKVLKHFLPVLSDIPRDFVWCVNFDGHYLANLSALDEDDDAAYPTRSATPIISSLNVFPNKGIIDIRARDNMGIFYRESKHLSMISWCCESYAIKWILTDAERQVMMLSRDRWAQSKRCFDGCWKEHASIAVLGRQTIQLRMRAPSRIFVGPWRGPRQKRQHQPCAWQLISEMRYVGR